MELATNLFTKGLLMDTNPMILGNDTLTDCLNGTLITMNGNEVILQNDMGNRRVDNAFLPPGYEPVGIKEYGGIIYVAAYNPITNKSLIGSFPSPEKRLSKEDDPNLGGEFDFDKFFDSNNVYTDLDLGIYVIKTDSFMIPLTKDTSLRAGDKFVVYGSLSSLKDLITNYENTCFAVKHIVNDLQAILISDTPEALTASDFGPNDKIDKPTDVEIDINPNLSRLRSVDYNHNTPGNKIVINKKVISPKNRKYTLQLGILNSQNEFVDITKTLVRWKNSNIVEYNDNVSELYKFNDGYFIPDSFRNPDLEETISDALFIRNRLTIEANTYSYKLIGPLYLKVNLNHIVRFNYNIYGIFTDYVSVDEICPGGLVTRGVPIVEPINNISKDCTVSDPIYLGYFKVFLGGLLVRKLRLWVEGYITYNCPDNDYPVSNIISNRIQLDELENNDENYATYEELDVSRLNTIMNNDNIIIKIYDFFDFIGDSVKLAPKETKMSKAVYNPDTNLYTIKVTKEYLIDDPNKEIYDYVIGVHAGFENKYNNNNVYLRDLSCKGSLNLSLLGSGNVDITGWRFYNDVEQRVTLLTVAFEAYPELNTRFENLNFNFKDITRLDELDYEGINYGGLPLYNGRQTYTIDWGDDFEPRKVYAVKITYDIVDEDENISHRTLDDYWTEPAQGVNNKYVYHKIHRWLLTTELFNEFYQSTSGISDFCDLREVDLEIATAFENKMHVNLRGKGDIVDKTKYSEKFEGGLVSKLADISYICNHLYNINLIANPEISIIDEELYPDFIKVKESEKNSINISSTSIKSIGNVEIDNQTLINNVFKDLLLLIRGNSLNFNSLTPFNTESDSLLVTNIQTNDSSKNIIGTITYKDIYKGYSTSVVSELYNVFDKLSNIINEALPPNGYFCGVVVQADDNGDPNHFVRVGRFSTSQTATLSGDAGINCDYVDIKTDHRHKPQFYSFSALAAKIYLEFNNSLSTPGQMFLYLYTTETNDNKYKLNDSSQWETGDNRTRLWWRTSENEWATFNNVLTVKNDNTLSGQDNIKNFILGKVKNYVYRMYDTYINNGSLSIYAADLDYMYYDRYDIPLTLVINYELEEDSSHNVIEVLEGTDILWGNLLFMLSVEDVESNEVIFNLKSSDIFHDTINTFDRDHISNIDLNTGALIDSSGEKLNPDSIYYYYDIGNDTFNNVPLSFHSAIQTGQNTWTVKFWKLTTTINGSLNLKIITTTYYIFLDIDEHSDLLSYEYYYTHYNSAFSQDVHQSSEQYLNVGLRKVNNPYFTVDAHNTINGKNTLVYNKYSFGRPNYCYQGAHVSEDDDETILYYNSVNIISENS